jgi:uncharacterized repeat protein (TIGR01451 family)
MLLASTIVPVMSLRAAAADDLLDDGFTGNTLSGSWLSGGNPDSACLTASTSTSGNIPGCDSETAIDTNGNGALRLTSNAVSQAGFVINQTPVSTNKGLQISFDMYQYNGNGADGIAFFLIDGSQSPTQPGAFGGSLGYSSNSDPTPGIAGGYVGVGFDVFGNFANPASGSGGPGLRPNSITVRGSQTSNYQYVTTKSATALLANNAATSRASAKRHVIISISTNNIMTVYVDYENSQGPIKELSNINLNTINGAGSLPGSLKFGFSASTGGSDNIHEISGLNVVTLAPSVSAKAAQSGTYRQGETGQYTIAAKNDAGAEPTTGDITVTDTLPSGLKPTAASGTGWACTVSGQTVSCTRPGDGANALAPGDSEPDITVATAISNTAASSLSNTVNTATTDNNSLNDAGQSNTFTIAAGDHDGADTTTENAAPNSGDANDDGTADTQQANVTSFVSSITGNYATLATSGDCDQNDDPYIASTAENARADSSYNYPAGMMNFSITCDAPGDTATVSQYYFGDYDAAQFVARKYNPGTNSYTTIPGAVITNVTVGGQNALKITYDIADGGPLDADGSANGTIVDPAGPAIKDPDPAAAGTLSDTGVNVLLAASLAGALMLAAVRVYRRQADVEPSAK